MNVVQEVVDTARDFVTYGMLLGFGLGGFLVLATEGVCSLVRFLKKTF